MGLKDFGASYSATSGPEYSSGGGAAGSPAPVSSSAVDFGSMFSAFRPSTPSVKAPSFSSVGPGSFSGVESLGPSPISNLLNFDTRAPQSRVDPSTGAPIDASGVVSNALIKDVKIDVTGAIAQKQAGNTMLPLYGEQFQADVTAMRNGSAAVEGPYTAKDLEDMGVSPAQLDAAKAGRPAFAPEAPVTPPAPAAPAMAGILVPDMPLERSVSPQAFLGHAPTTSYEADMAKAGADWLASTGHPLDKAVRDTEAAWKREEAKFLEPGVGGWFKQGFRSRDTADKLKAEHFAARDKRDEAYSLEFALLRNMIPLDSGGTGAPGTSGVPMDRFGRSALKPGPVMESAPDLWEEGFQAVNGRVNPVLVRKVDFAYESNGEFKDGQFPPDLAGKAVEGASVYDPDEVRNAAYAYLDEAAPDTKLTNGQVMERAGFDTEKFVDATMARLSKDSKLTFAEVSQAKIASAQLRDTNSARTKSAAPLSEIEATISSLDMKGQALDTTGWDQAAIEEKNRIDSLSSIRLRGLQNQVRTLRAGIMDGSIKGETAKASTDALNDEITAAKIELNQSRRSVMFNADGSQRDYSPGFFSGRNYRGETIRTTQHWGNILMAVGGIAGTVTPLLTTFWLNPRENDKQWDREKKKMDMQYDYWLKQFAIEQQGRLDAIAANYAGAASVKATTSGGSSGGGDPSGNTNIQLASAK